MSKLIDYKPAQGYYLITPLEEDKSKEDIILIEDAERPFTKGVIIRVGDPYISEYATVIEPQFEKGSIVIYSASKFEQITAGGEMAHIVRSGAIVATYE